MRRIGVTMCMFLMGLTAQAETGPKDARALLKEGIAAFERGDAANAEAAFAGAAEATNSTKLDRAVPTYNQGVALLEQGLPEQASAPFEEALRTEDLKLQSRAYYNRGNAIMSTVEPQVQQDQLQPALESTKKALEMYERAISLAPEDVDAKANFELAELKRKKIEQIIEQQPPQQQQQNQDSSEDESEQEQQEDQQPGDDQQEQQDQQPQQGEDEQKQGEDQNEQPQPDESEEGKEQQQASEEMTEEEAQMLLEAMKEEEAAAREKMRLQLGQPAPVAKDW